jgi:APA family basic amino acid/polyamine antiporter
LPTPPLKTLDQPSRVLGAADTTSVVIGAIVGVGIFFTPSRVAQIVQSGGLALIAWGVAGAIALAGALAFAELGGMYHGSGAQYAILRDAYGPLPAFLFVFCNATAVQAGAIGIIAVICAVNLGVAVAGTPPAGNALNALAAALIVGIVLANVGGVRFGARIQNATVITRIASLVAVAVLAALAPAAQATPAPPLAARPAALAMMAALVPAFFSYGGWQHALWIAGEVREPRQNVPRAIVGGVVVVVMVYLLANWAYLHLLGVDGVAASKTLASDAVAVVLPSVGRRLVAGAVAVSAFGVLNAQLLSGPRLLYGMARDGRFFRAFGTLSGPSRTPAAAIVLLGTMALLLLLVAGVSVVDRLLSGVVFIDGIFFVLTGAALFVLRRRRPDADRPVRVLGYPLVPAVFVIGEIGVVVGAYVAEEARRAAYIGLGWIVAGAILYAARFREGAAASGAG